MTHVVAYIATLIAFFAIDIAWLGLVAKKFYAEQLGDMLLDSPNWSVAIVFYLLYIAGIVFVRAIFASERRLLFFQFAEPM